jgi:hypothetical protein
MLNTHAAPAQMHWAPQLPTAAAANARRSNSRPLTTPSLLKTTPAPPARAVLQFLLSPLLLWRAWVSSSLSCALYAAAFCHYHYLTFLGYSALPFLERTEVFLWPIGAICVALPLAILFGFNPTRFVLSIYFS